MVTYGIWDFYIFFLFFLWDGMDQNPAKPRILADFSDFGGDDWGCTSIIGDFGVKKRVPRVLTILVVIQIHGNIQAFHCEM